MNGSEITRKMPPGHANAIFLKDLNKDDVLGPIISKDNKYLFLKVLGWTNSVLISETQKANHLKSVKEKISIIEKGH